MSAVAVASSRPIRRPSRLRYARKVAPVYGGLLLFAIPAGLPIYWMIITTFKPDRDLYNLQNFPLWFNQNGITLDHLNPLFTKTHFFTWLTNTMWVSAAVVLITLVLSLPAGYALARLRFRGSEALSIGIFLTYLVPT